MCAAPPLPAGRDPVGLYGMPWVNAHAPCLAISGTRNPSGTADHTRDHFLAVRPTTMSITDPYCKDSLCPVQGSASKDLPHLRGCLNDFDLIVNLDDFARLPDTIS